MKTPTSSCGRCGRAGGNRRGLCNACYMAYCNRQKAYGRWESQYVPVEPVRAHILALRAAGVGTRTISERAGVARSTVTTALGGKARPGHVRKPATQILRKNADAILSVSIPEDVRDSSGNINATGTRRRIQALIAYGYSQRDLSRRLGYASDNLTIIVSGQLQVVKPSTRDRVARLFAELQMTPGQCARARTRGRDNRWPLPLDWDEESIDDPTSSATRSPSRKYDPKNDPERIAWRRSKVVDLLDAGYSATEIAVQLKCTVRTIERDKTEIRRPDPMAVAS